MTLQEAMKARHMVRRIMRIRAHMPICERIAYEKG